MIAQTSTIDQKSSSRLRRIARSPLACLLVAILSIAVALAASNGLLALWPSPPAWTRSIVTILLVHTAYIVYVRVYERRAVTELDRWSAGRGLTLGFLSGIALVSLSLLVLRILGVFDVVGFNGWTQFPRAVAVAAGAAYVEEILFRGIIYRLLERATGTWLALVGSALIFGLMHMGNPGATVSSSIAIALEAGILLGAVFVFSRRLWAPIGLHLGWNLAVGGLYGLAVSGTSSSGVLQSELQGPAWLSGGQFGIEASLVAVVLSTALAGALLFHASRRRLIIAPAWRKANRN